MKRNSIFAVLNFSSGVDSILPISSLPQPLSKEKQRLWSCINQGFSYINIYHALFPRRIHSTFLYSFACSLSKIPTFFRQSSSLSCNGRIIHSRRALQRVFIRDSMALWRNTILVRQAPISRVAPEIRWNKIKIKLSSLCRSIKLKIMYHQLLRLFHFYHIHINLLYINL